MDAPLLGDVKSLSAPKTAEFTDYMITAASHAIIKYEGTLSAINQLWRAGGKLTDTQREAISYWKEGLEHYIRKPVSCSLPLGNSSVATGYATVVTRFLFFVFKIMTSILFANSFVIRSHMHMCDVINILFIFFWNKVYRNLPNFPTEDTFLLADLGYHSTNHLLTLAVQPLGSFLKATGSGLNKTASVVNNNDTSLYFPK